MRALALTLSSLALLLPTAAHADTFSFTVSNPAGDLNVSGQLTASLNADTGLLTATAIAGSGITGLLSPGAVGNDNALFPGADRLLDVNGIAYTDVFENLSRTVNLFSTVSGYEALVYDASGALLADDTATFTLAGATTPTPEPSAFLLLGTGVLSLAGAVRRSFTTRA